MPASCARTLKGARKAPGCLSLRVCACVQARWVFLCVSVCTCICACGFHCTEASSSLFTGTGDWEGTERPLPLFLSNAKPQSPASWCHQAQRDPASRAVGEGRGRTPSAAPHSCAGRKDPCCCPSVLRWEEGPPLLPLTPALGGRTPAAAPHSCAGRKPGIFTHRQVWWRGRAPRRQFPWQVKLPWEAFIKKQ